MGRPQVLLQKCSVLWPTQLLERVQHHFADRPARPGLPKVFASRTPELLKQIVAPIIEAFECAHLRHQVGDWDLAASAATSLRWCSRISSSVPTSSARVPVTLMEAIITSSMQVHHGEPVITDPLGTWCWLRSTLHSCLGPYGHGVMGEQPQGSAVDAVEPPTQHSTRGGPKVCPSPRGAPLLQASSADHRTPVRGRHHLSGTALVVFVDGCFWHGCPQHATFPKTNAEWWARKLQATRQRDLDNERALTAGGWTVLRVWEHEATTDAVARIRAALTSAAIS